MKKLLSILFGLIALIFLAVLIVPMFVDVSSYRQTLTDMVEKKTGYVVTIEGDISLSLLPSAALDVERIVIHNHKEAKDQLVAIESAEISVDLWALLEDKIAVKNVGLSSPVITLKKYKNGTNNWKAIKPEMPEETQDSPEKKISSAPLLIASAHAEEVVVIKKAASTLKVSIEEIRIKGGVITFEDVAKGSVVALKDIFFTSSRDDSHYPFSFSSDIGGTIAPNEPFIIKGVFETDGATYHAKNIDFSYRNVSDGFGSLSVNLSEAMPFVTASLNLKELNLDRLKKAEDVVSESFFSQWLINQAHAQAPVVTANHSPPWNDTPISLDVLSQFNAKINLEIQTLRLQKLLLGPIALNTYLNHGYLQSKLKKFSFAEGNITGETIINIAGATPKYKQTLYITDVQLDQIAPHSTLSKSAKGTFSGALDVASKGVSTRAMVANMSGETNFSVNDGEIKNVDILAMIKNVQSAFGNHSSSVKTVFDRTSSSFTIKNGVMYSDDGLLYSQWLRVTGKGTIHLPKWRIDYKVTPDDSEGTELAKFRESSIPIIPVFVRGPLTDPQFIPDLTALAKHAIKNNKQLGKVIGKASEQLEKVFGKEEGDVLKQEVLKGLEGILNGF